MKPKAIKSADQHWLLSWPDGSFSLMPDETAARTCAAIYGFLPDLRILVNAVDQNPFSGPAWPNVARQLLAPVRRALDSLAGLPQPPKPAGACYCENCGWSGEEDKAGGLASVPDLLQRIEPGGEVPAGVCPDCGALAYLTEE